MENRIDRMMNSRFAQVEDVFTEPFKKINIDVMRINQSANFVNHDKINAERFNWFTRLGVDHSYYASRFWEYPFAIIASNITKGMKCADIGCGTTPFTPYLCELAGNQNITGIDNDLLIDDEKETHFSFGVRKSFVDKFGFNFIDSEIDNINAPDNSFDVVFCLSVLEHINDAKQKQRGLLEMGRVLKPGGKLILTFDTGIHTTLNDPLKIISLSGLLPFEGISFEWPKHRFVQYKDLSMDVFGLVLQKDDSEIFLKQDETETISRYLANKKYLKHATDYNIEFTDLLKVRDLKQRFGWLKVGLKQLLKRY